MAAKARAVLDLDSHPEAFLKVAQLADYWQISSQQVLRLIESGALDAVRLGTKTYRIPTSAARQFERRGSNAHGSRRIGPSPKPAYASAPPVTP